MPFYHLRKYCILQIVDEYLCSFRTSMASRKIFFYGGQNERGQKGATRKPREIAEKQGVTRKSQREGGQNEMLHGVTFVLHLERGVRRCSNEDVAWVIHRGENGAVQGRESKEFKRVGAIYERR